MVTRSGGEESEDFDVFVFSWAWLKSRPGLEVPLLLIYQVEPANLHYHRCVVLSLGFKMHHFKRDKCDASPCVQCMQYGYCPREAVRCA